MSELKNSNNTILNHSSHSLIFNLTNTVNWNNIN